MKKITFLMVFMSFVSLMAYAGGDWATSAVSLTKDGGSSYLYVLNNQGWTDGTWGSNTAFDGYNFGTPTSLILNGGAGNAWANGGDYYDATSFVIYYRVYKSSDTPGTWSSISLMNQAYHNVNNYIYDKTDANIDILALASSSGTYTLEVVMAKNQYWNGGNWNSMVPGGQGTAYNESNAGYKATFVKVMTGVSKLETSLQLSGANGKVTAHFDGSAKVELFNVSGQLMHAATVSNEFTQQVPSGAYLLRINGKTHKVLVR